LRGSSTSWCSKGVSRSRRAALANFDRQRSATTAAATVRSRTDKKSRTRRCASRRGSSIRRRLPGAVDRVFAPVILAEPFKIPRRRCGPREVGDFILVNKFIYGIRLPILERKLIPIGDPKRGDVVVFRYPVNPSQDFIKRVIGVGGDVVEYRDKRLTVNGELWPQKADGTYSYLEGLRFDTLEREFERTDAAVGAQEHTIGINPQAQPVYPPNVRNFPGRENCDYNERGFTCRYPPDNT
jgi:signal peptidase I